METVVINNLGFPLGEEITGLPGIRVVDAPSEPGAVPDDVRGEVLWTRHDGGPNFDELIERGVRWVQTMGTGVDAFPVERVGDRTLACSRGASAVMISEWVLAHMLAAVKSIPGEWLDAPPAGGWNSTRARIRGLAGETVVIVGTGGIGSRIARLCLAFEMRVVGVRRRDLPAPVEGMEMSTDLRGAVADADHLVIAAPATAATRHLVDADVLAAAKPGLHLVNIARGTLVDQDALRRALDDGQVSLASLDTVDPEPLPEGHWLYDHERVRLTPHTSWAGPGAMTAMVAAFVTNYHHYRAGEPLEGVVDPAHGY